MLSIDVTGDFPEIAAAQLRTKIVIHCFNDFYVGDLACLAMILGMCNSDRYYCIFCHAVAPQFNKLTGNLEATRKRTQQSLMQCLHSHQQELASCTTKKKPANYRGVNSHPLLQFDPQRIIIPILHTPMGLVDKILESFNLWVNLEVERLPPSDDMVRSNYKTAKALSEDAKVALGNATALNEQLGNQQSLEALALAKKTCQSARKHEREAKDTYDDSIQKHNATLGSLHQRFEQIFRRNNITREYYHGGKFNGVNCIKIMERATPLFVGDVNEDGFYQKCVAMKQDNVTDGSISEHCHKFAALLGLLDATWSTVRGVDAGILPTAEQIDFLDKSIQRAKTLWIDLALTTTQPKWHLTFDGHLLEQVKQYGGLADKADDTIEFQHQRLKRLRDRYRRVSSFQRKTKCMLKELRRQRSKRVERQIKAFEKAKKQKSGTKRQRDAEERQEGVKTEKKAKRATFVG